MRLDDILILGTTAIMGTALIYKTHNLQYSATRAKEATTRFLDAATTYLAPRIQTPKDLKAFRDLAETREEYKI
jgi:hypothetical protein